jgi:hypothetical protein
MSYSHLARLDEFKLNPRHQPRHCERKLSADAHQLALTAMPPDIEAIILTTGGWAGRHSQRQARGHPRRRDHGRGSRHFQAGIILPPDFLDRQDSTTGDDGPIPFGASACASDIVEEPDGSPATARRRADLPHNWTRHAYALCLRGTSGQAVYV